MSLSPTFKLTYSCWMCQGAYVFAKCASDQGIGCLLSLATILPWDSVSHWRGNCFSEGVWPVNTGDQLSLPPQCCRYRHTKLAWLFPWVMRVWTQVLMLTDQAWAEHRQASQQAHICLSLVLTVGVKCLSFWISAPCISSTIELCICQSFLSWVHLAQSPQVHQGIGSARIS